MDRGDLSGEAPTPGDAEVEECYAPVVHADEDVVRSDIHMDGAQKCPVGVARGMESLEGAGHLKGNMNDGYPRQTSAGLNRCREDPNEGDAGPVFQEEIGPPFDLPRIDALDEVGMVRLRRQVLLMCEERRGRRIVATLYRRPLEDIGALVVATMNEKDLRHGADLDPLVEGKGAPERVFLSLHVLQNSRRTAFRCEREREKLTKGSLGGPGGSSG